MLDKIREEAPIHKTPGNFWVLSRHADVLAVLRDKTSSADSLNVAEGKEPIGLDSATRSERSDLIAADGGDQRPFLFRDPPDHTRLRGLVQRAFTPRRIAELTPFITDVARSTIARHLDAGPIDAVQEIAFALPVAVICEMLAIPKGDHESFQHHSALLARGLDPDFMLSDADRSERDEALMHFVLYFSALVDERRKAPGDDLLSALVAARDGEDALSEGELLSTAILLLVAGHETTMNLISGSMLALSGDLGAQRDLRERGVDRAAVDELLRFVSPVQLTGRTLLADQTVGDETLEAGSFVMLLLAAANRDPAAFERPATLDLTRDPNPQIGFGFGLHHCLGSPLARLEAQVVLDELLAMTSSFDVVGETPYRPNVVLRGLAELPVELRS